MSVFEDVKALLDSRGIAYRCVHHEPTRTSEESAAARGVDLAVGGKAILMKVDDDFRLFVFSAARRINSRKITKHLGAKKLRFASPAELHQLTGLAPGSVPPFGRPVLPFDLHVDISIRDNAVIAFNAGSPTDSIIMQTDDYLRIVQAGLLDFTG